MVAWDVREADIICHLAILRFGHTFRKAADLELGGIPGSLGVGVAVAPKAGGTAGPVANCANWWRHRWTCRNGAVVEIFFSEPHCLRKHVHCPVLGVRLPRFPVQGQNVQSATHAFALASEDWPARLA